MQLSLLLATAFGLVMWFCLATTSYKRGYTANLAENDPAVDFEFGIFGVYMLITAALGGALTMRGYITKEKRISAMMLPAPQSCKFLANAVIYLILMPIAILVGLYIIDLIRVGILHAIFPFCTLIHTLTFDAISLTWEQFFKWLLPIFLVFQATFTLGATVTPKGAIIKTALAAFIWILVMVWLGTLLVKVLDEPDMFYHPDINEVTGGYIYDVLSLLYCTICYTIAYLRYKEIEIIQRW